MMNEYITQAGFLNKLRSYDFENLFKSKKYSFTVCFECP